jgi:hypothetical protein
MNYQVEPSGEIILRPTARETDLLIKAMNHTVLLRQERRFTPPCDEALCLIVTLTDALVQSNRIKIHTVAELHAPALAPVRRGWFSALVDFFYPPFSVEDFEWALPYNGALIHLTDMDFESSMRGFPVRVTGKVMYEHRWLPASWDRRGKCTVTELGGDAEFYDLVRCTPQKKSSTL